MRPGLGGMLLLLAATTAGCLTPNPALTDSSGDTEGDDTGTTATTGSPSGSPETTETPSSTTDTSATSTTQGPTTTDPDTTATEGSGTTSLGETDDTGPAACGSGNVCAPEAPMDWAGPVIWAETLIADEPPACPAAYPEPAFSAFDDLQAPPAECGCECGAASGASCATLTLEDHAGDSSCVGGADEEFAILANGSCNAAPNEPSAQYWNVDDPGVTGGSCTPSDSVSIPQAGWAAQSVLCGGASPSLGECAAAESCVPQPDPDFESRLCVWQPGDLQCPDGSYADRFVRHGDYSDSRNCAACTCGNPTGSCTGTVRLWTDPDCTDGGGTAPGPSGVIDIGGGCERGQTATQYDVASAAAGTLSVQDVSCAPSVGTAIGEAQAVDPYTLCCMTLTP